MRNPIPVGITPLPKDIRGNRNNRLGTVRTRVIQNPDVGRTGRPELANTGRDAGITSSPRGESGGFAGLPPK